jgi:hypothetical protein
LLFGRIVPVQDYIRFMFYLSVGNPRWPP